MEKHKCKLCFRNFSNGRALGGHMRSHMMNLAVPPRPNDSSPPPPPPPTIQLSFEAESASSPSSSSSEDDNNNNDKGLCYGLRENPKRSFRLADPEFADTGSVILQDRESETESSKNPTRRRSKRPWKFSLFDHHHNKQSQEQQQQQIMKKIKLSIPSNKNESLSSVSDTTTEEDVAFCLMMLSRDKWKRQHVLLEHRYEEEEEAEENEEQQPEEEDEEDEEDEEEEDEEESDESEEELKSSKTTTTTTRVRGRYKCETCNKVFRSYQALGGHRASHKKIKVVTVEEQPKLEHESNNNNNGNRANSSSPIMVDNNKKMKVHECPVCFRVFASGQALGGHKRTHVIGSSATTTITTATRVRSSIKFGASLIDLNLPAPMDYDDVSQIEDSAVSDAEFVKSH